MNTVACVVRYLIVCEDILYPSGKPTKATLVNVTSFIQSHGNPPYPLPQPPLCVFVQLTECRGGATIRLDVVRADNNALIYRIGPNAVTFGTDPLHVYGIPFRLRGCSFPAAGLDWMQFWYNDTLAAQQPLILR